MDCILIADDEEDFCAILARVLSALGYQAYWTTSPSEVLPLLEKVRPSCVLLDLNFPNLSGMTVLSRIKKHHKNIPVVILTGQDCVRTAVQAIQQGAFHYLTKPLDKDKKELKAVLAKAVRQDKMHRRIPELKKRLGQIGSWDDFVDFSKEVRDFIQIELGEPSIPGVSSPPSASPSTLTIPRTASFSEASRQALQHIEKQWILDALKKSFWRRGQAARLLGIDAKTLYSKMKVYGIHHN